MIAILCPGQGSQTPGFLAPWLELPGVGQRLAGTARPRALDLATHGTTSDAETIKDTAVAQPLIVAAGLVAAHALFDGGGDGAAAPTAAPQQSPTAPSPAPPSSPAIRSAR